MPSPASAVAAAPILFVHHAGINWIRGSTRCLLDLLTHIDRGRFRPVVLCNQPVILDAVRALDVEAHQARDWNSPHPLRPDRQYLADVNAAIDRHRIRLIHSDEFTQASVLLPAARRARIPLLSQLHQVPTRDERLWSLLHQVDLAVGTTRACVTGLLEDGFPPDRAIVVYNGVDPVRLGQGDATRLRAELRIPPGAVVVTLVGSLIHRKAVDVALHAMARLRTSADVRLLLAGSGPERTALERLAASLGVQDRTTFLGECAQAGAVLRDATDVLVAPSRDESFGLTLAEAGLFGIPAVASDIPAHQEVVGEDGGVLFPVEDAGAMAAALDRIAGDQVLRKRLGEGARRRVTSMFLIDRYVREFEAKYTSLMARPASQYGWRSVRWTRAYSAWIREALARRLGRAENPGLEPRAGSPASRGETEEADSRISALR
jgi:glycosyltransferase involved in cell wall biosynthesis